MSNDVQFLIKPKGLIEIELYSTPRREPKVLAFGLCLCVFSQRLNNATQSLDGRESSILDFAQKHLLLELRSNRKMLAYQYQPKADPDGSTNLPEMTDPRVGHFRNPRKSTLLC
jgi:hypothetical protein